MSCGEEGIVFNPNTVINKVKDSESLANGFRKALGENKVAPFEAIWQIWLSITLDLVDGSKGELQALLTQAGINIQVNQLCRQLGYGGGLFGGGNIIPPTAIKFLTAALAFSEVSNEQQLVVRQGLKICKTWMTDCRPRPIPGTIYDSHYQAAKSSIEALESLLG